MRLRPYIPDRDFDVIKYWITDERTHALWCGDRAEYPLARGSFDFFLREIAANNGDTPFVALNDFGRPMGFFCISVSTETNEAMLKFVVVDPIRRGKGVGREMLSLAVKYAFEIAGAESLRLCVFSGNVPAIRCYEAVGFTIQSTDTAAFDFGIEKWDRCHMIKYKTTEGEQRQ